eukprot:1153050-Pelagomonas_calceolata.AAC.4
MAHQRRLAIATPCTYLSACAGAYLSQLGCVQTSEGQWAVLSTDTHARAHTHTHTHTHTHALVASVGACRPSQAGLQVDG